MSTSSEVRDFNIVWETVSHFIKIEQVKELKVIAFNTSIIWEVETQINSGALSKLQKNLRALEYSGLSNYDVIQQLDTDGVLLVSDGNPVFGEGHFHQDIPTYSINNTEYLKKLSKFTGGKVLALTNDNIIVDNPITSSIADIDISSNLSGFQIKGKVVSVSGPLQGVTIRIGGTLEEHKTKADGTFLLKIPEKTIITFNYLGMYPKSLSVGELSKTDVIELIPKQDVLGEVVLKEQRNTGKEKLHIGNEEIKKDAVGFGSGLISNKEIKPWHTSVFDVLGNKISGVLVIGSGRNRQVFIRGEEPKWIIDGVIISDPSSPIISSIPVTDIVNTQNIESISIIKNRGGVLAYGKGPYIFIKTKGNLINKIERKPSTLVEGNNYNDSVVDISDGIVSPPYIKELFSLKSTQARYERYKEMAKTYSSISFYIDMVHYFQKYDLSISDRILEELTLLGRSNVKVLRVVAYMYEAGGNNNLARLTYENILKLAPNETQSYRDLALIYQEVGEYNKSLELYINMLDDQVMGIDFSGLEKPLKNEFNHLISRYKDKIEFARLPNEWLRVGYNIDLRMVITWSDRNTPFEFQFVNPDKKYFKWTHTIDQQRERLFQEQSQGFQTEEFIIDNAASGEWLVNIQYLGEKDELTIPPYLKHTTYRNYGTPKETKEIKIIKLHQLEEKVTLCKINT